MESRPTASIIVIGDEILKGQVKDTNSYFMAKELFACGVKVDRISMISDSTQAIADEVLDHSRKYTFVFTTGGIGPTHDDVTYKGIAKAFGVKLIVNKDVSKMFMALGFDNETAVKLSTIPDSSEIHPTKYGTRPGMPIISVNNVFIFPGIPFYMELTFQFLKYIFTSTSTAFFTQNIFVNASESCMSDTLNKAVDEFNGRVIFGSYPVLFSDQYQIKISLQADSEADVSEAESFLRGHLPANWVVVQHSPSSTEAVEKMKDCMEMRLTKDEEFVAALAESVKVIEQCLAEYNMENVCFSFNGGKDCTVLLHLTHLVLLRKHPARKIKLKMLYVRSWEPFPEVEEFITMCVQRYGLDLISYDPPIKAALTKLKTDHPEIQAVLMGCRNTDPRCSELLPFQMTDCDWPQLMRVNPLAKWSFNQVWMFLRLFEVAYCGLYDKGYTSLGCRFNTLPNEQLLSKTKHGDSFYLPAYLLKDPAQERNGRYSSKI